MRSSFPVKHAPKHLDDVDEPLTRDKLLPVNDLYSVFKDIEAHILAHQAVDTFNEIFKVVFAKLYDERVNLPEPASVARFQTFRGKDQAFVASDIRLLFEAAKKTWQDVYDSSERILLHDANLAYCVKVLGAYSLLKSGDVLGVAFELLVNQELKGDKGQYFTPRQVVSMMVQMGRPALSEVVCDPACGSGGFLTQSMRHAFECIHARWQNPEDRREKRKHYAQNNLIGMDHDPRLVKVAKAYMIMEEDGHSSIFAVDSLDYGVYSQHIRERLLRRKLRASDCIAQSLVDTRRADDGASVILTNPPFAGFVNNPATLNQYDLARDEKGKPVRRGVRAGLFLERCIDLLAPGGRMGIVLPQGIFNNAGDQPIRNLIDQKARVLAVVGLHPYTFKPFTLAKTSVLFLQKWQEGEHLDDYPIFTAVSMRPGKTKLGAPQYLDDGKTLDCDMGEIASAFVTWGKQQGFAFLDETK